MSAKLIQFLYFPTKYSKTVRNIQIIEIIFIRHVKNIIRNKKAIFLDLEVRFTTCFIIFFTSQQKNRRFYCPPANLTVLWIPENIVSSDIFNKMLFPIFSINLYKIICKYKISRRNTRYYV